MGKDRAAGFGKRAVIVPARDEVRIEHVDLDVANSGGSSR